MFQWLGIRLLEMKRILKPTGSIYLHCDRTASHYLKLCMDAICGCATTLVAADRLQRQWIGCDFSKLAAELVDQRIIKALLRRSLLFFNANP
jgi:DNA modification methylase